MMSNAIIAYLNAEDASLGTNGIQLPSPSYSGGLKVTHSTLVDSGRSATGRVIGQKVMNRDLVKLSVSWSWLLNSQWNYILDVVYNSEARTGTYNQGFYIWLNYYDPQYNARITREFYPSDRNATVFSLDKDTGQPTAWTNCSIKFIDTGNSEEYIYDATGSTIEYAPADSPIAIAIDGKIDKISSPVAGAFPIMDSEGELVTGSVTPEMVLQNQTDIAENSNEIEQVQSDILANSASIAQNESDIVTLEGVVDTNRLYSDSQYLDLKAKYEAQQIALNASKAELYTDAPILQYGTTEIIGKGYESDDTPIDVSANVVDGKLSMEQKGLTIRNLVRNGDFSGGFVAPWAVQDATHVSTVAGVTTFIAVAKNGRVRQNSGATFVDGNKYFYAVLVKADSSQVKIEIYPQANSPVYTAHTGSGNWELLGVIATGSTGSTNQFNVLDNRSSGWTNVQVAQFRLYNLTALGLDHITDTAILAKLLPYVDGTKAVGKMGIQINGINILDTKAYVNSFKDAPVTRGTLNLQEDSLMITSIASDCFIANYIGVGSVLPIERRKGLINVRRLRGKTIYHRRTIIGLSGTSNEFYSLYDDNFTCLSLVSMDTFSGVRETEITIPKDATYLAIRYGIAYGVQTVKYTDFMISLISTTSLPYEPYQEQLTFLPAIGNSLPNGTADSIKTVADGWEHTKRVYTPEAVLSGVAVNTANYPTAKDGGQWVNELTAGGTEIGVVGTDSTTGAGILRFELATPIVTKYDLPHLTSGKTIHRFAGEEKIALYSTGLTFSENVLSVLSAIKFTAGEMTDITDDATITGDTVTFSGVDATDVVFAQVEHDVDKPLGVLEHTPTVSNTASRLASLEARVSALEV